MSEERTEITTPAEYQEAALRTLAPDSTIDLDRVHWGTIRRALRQAVENGGLLDHIKKSVAYGKPFPKQMSAGEVACPRPSAEVPVQVVHAVLGMLTEAAEMAQALEAALFGGAELDTVNLLEESSDMDWYQALLDATVDGSQEERWNTNIAKLAARYSRSTGDVEYSDEDALNRDTDAEREILEEGHGSDETAPSEEEPGKSEEDSEPSADSSDEEVEAEADEPVVLESEETETEEDEPEEEAPEPDEEDANEDK